jgi:hypothetical protein
MDQIFVVSVNSRRLNALVIAPKFMVHSTSDGFRLIKHKNTSHDAALRLLATQ